MVLAAHYVGTLYATVQHSSALILNAMTTKSTLLLMETAAQYVEIFQVNVVELFVMCHSVDLEESTINQKVNAVKSAESFQLDVRK